MLKNLHVDMTGSYTCEVSTEGFFETALGKSNMTVIGKLTYLSGIPSNILILSNDLILRYKIVRKNVLRNKEVM